MALCCFWPAHDEQQQGGDLFNYVEVVAPWFPPGHVGGFLSRQDPPGLVGQLCSGFISIIGCRFFLRGV